MPGLTIILSTAEPERLRGALVIAMSWVALGEDASLFLQLDAAALAERPLIAPRDDAHRAAGLPDLASTLDQALNAGVVVRLCQSGLTLAGLTMDQVDRRLRASGPIAILSEAQLADRRIIMA